MSKGHWWLALLCAMAILLGAAQAQEQIWFGQTLTYTGETERVNAAGLSGDELLQASYALTDTPYILLNQPYVWELGISGGQAPYEITAMAAHQDDMSLDEFADPWMVIDSFPVSDLMVNYTFTSSGRYFWQFTVTDSLGQSITFQTRIYETYEAADETNALTTVGKVNALVDALIDDSMSDYTRALVLHDWLIYNANYDYTYTHYDASGVLLKGSGVCDSYARAYLMLCTAAGLECMYVSGTSGSDPNPANWGNHGWNLVKLGGSWYHVDCTMDDPGTGGKEQHVYFCVDDETMAKDHRWNRPHDIFDQGGMLTPEAEGGIYEADEPELGDYDFTFATWDEFEQKFDQLVARGERRAKTVGWYTGTRDDTDMYADMKSWASTKSQALANEGLITAAGYGHYGELFTYRLTWREPVSYLRVREETLRLSAGQKASFSPTELEPAADVFTWSSSNEDVAAVTHTYDAASGTMTVTVTALKLGEAVITGVSADGLTDSVKVSVLPAYQPELALQLEQAGQEVRFTWSGVPGATEYRLIRTFEGEESLLAVTTGTEIAIPAAQLPDNVAQLVHLQARRCVGQQVHATYGSQALSYGHYVFDYEVTLPANLTSIGAEAFQGSRAVQSVYIPDGVTRVETEAFSGCGELAVVRIPDSVTFIAENAFIGCPLKYAQVSPQSYAASWLRKYMPDVMLVE